MSFSLSRAPSTARSRRWLGWGIGRAFRSRRTRFTRSRRPHGTPLGAIIENQTAIELARGGRPLAGWKRSPAGSAIDFIVKAGQTAVPVECKASLTANLRHMRGLVAYLGSHGQRRGYIASLAPYAETSVDGVQIVNLPAYLLERLVGGVP